MRRVLVLGMLVAACSGGDSPGYPPGYVTRSMLGDAWPLTVEEGVLRCEPPGAIIFETGGVDYGVNGLAADFADLDPIWAADPSGVSPKKNIGPLIERGQALC